jgi:uncharacterized protein YcfJ
MRLSCRAEHRWGGQLIAREVTGLVTNHFAGQIAADIGKSFGGKTGGTIGRAIVHGTLGGILRRWRRKCADIDF